MASRNIDYTHKKVLLIDSSGNLRSTIFYMLRELGVRNVKATTVNEKVLQLIQEESFDIILLGHNSSDAVTGLQLLEEARFRGFIRPTAGWIFMTSDASQEVVLHAIDSRPDDLLTRPFSIEELKSRLDNLVLRKEVMAPVEQAIEAGDLEAAVQACDDLPRQDANRDYARRLKASLLLQLHRPDEAYAVLEPAFWQTPDKELGLCMAQALVAMRRLAEAQDLLESLIEHYPLLIAAYDLMAQVCEQSGDLDGAREMLQLATSKAPLGIPRQMELGRVATQTRVLELAEGAYRKSIALGRNSCYRSPEPYLRLANIRRLEMQGADIRRQIELRNELDAHLNKAEYSFPGDAALKVRTALLRANVAQDLGEMQEAHKYRQDAERRNAELDLPLQLERESLILAGDHVPVLEPEPEVVDTGTQRDQGMSDKVNRLGVKHYLAGKLSQAIRYFGLAIEYDPGNAAALLNLAQLFMEAARDSDGKREQRLKMVDRYLRLTERLPLNTAETLRQSQLRIYRKQPLEELPGGSLGVLLR
ncbi:tetratricopeptide repeat protein [Marinobacterium sediminicola]|uniref:TPR repeat-containing protein n=1 Tax=Marinobacterium sediminicola TaxID=518898 RepID=A0ABY1S0P7_9GAMM|nr:response regulator [Marinobacterium sediminicola]ULG69719.1 response regulator [Marinobacterium sediminicola]SMR74550.1 TPR repeat-containing protein [Marinobacterium sediminicola]